MRDSLSINGQVLIFPCFNYTSISLIAYWIHETEAFRLSFGRMLHVPRITYSVNERISPAFLLLCGIILASPSYKRLYARQLATYTSCLKNLIEGKILHQRTREEKSGFQSNLSD